jgi:type IV fimbrial biogenesis protein FimT
MQSPPPTRTSTRRRPSGFTLVELLVTLVVLALLLTLGVPAFAGLLRQWRLDAAADAFAGDMRLARSTATRVSRNVEVCVQNGSGACDTQANWARGWLVFIDLNADHQLNAGETVVAQRGPQSGIASMTHNGAAANRLSFRANGTLNSSKGVTMSLLATGTAAEGRTVTLNAMGRSYVTKTP